MSLGQSGPWTAGRWSDIHGDLTGGSCCGVRLSADRVSAYTHGPMRMRVVLAVSHVRYLAPDCGTGTRSAEDATPIGTSSDTP